MISLFRRLIFSKVGIVVAFILFALFGLSMVGGDMSGLRTQGLAALGGGAGGDPIRVGGTKVTAEELAQRVKDDFEQYRQQAQQPNLTLAQYVATGGFDATVNRQVDQLALAQFGTDQGMLVSKRAIDGIIASDPNLQGPDGKFDANAFRQLLAARKLTERGVRTDMTRGLLAAQLTAPVGAQQQTVALQLALPYASMLLDKRFGQIAFVPSKAMPAGAAPADTELQAYYRSNLVRYTVPERRQIRVARISPDLVRARAAPSDADIARQYRQDALKYAPTEKRTITQVTVLTQAAAAQLAARIRAGTPIAAAATAAGLTPKTLPALARGALAGQTSPALADATFGAQQDAVVGPVRGGLGFVVAHVDKVEQVAGRSLAQAHDEIAAALLAQRTTDGLNQLHDQIDDALSNNATFDEIARDRGLQAQTSAPLLPNGVDPDRPGTPDPALAPVLAAAYQMADGDAPQLVQTGSDGSFALVALGRIVPAAPRPLAQLREQLTRDVVADRARQAARRIAEQLLARVNGGATLQAAWAQARVGGEGPKPLAVSRVDIDRAQGPAKQPLALLFAMAVNTAKLLEAPGGAGWAIVRLDRIEHGDASRDTARVTAVRQAFGQVLGREYTEQFARAARGAVGVTLNQAAIAKVKATMLGQTTQ